MHVPSPEIITENDYAKILESGEAGPVKHGYPAVIMHPDRSITKLWAKKSRILSSSRWKLYSARFIANAGKLASHGVNVPKIIRHQRINGSHVHLVRYTALEGTSIRELLETAPSEVDIPSLARYIHGLHERGIFFRAIHLGNIIRMSDEKFGLIDFTDVKFSTKPLPFIRRAANIATPLRYREDVERIKQAALPGLSDSYLEIMRDHNQPVDKNIFLNTIKKRMRGKS